MKVFKLDPALYVHELRARWRDFPQLGDPKIQVYFRSGKFHYGYGNQSDTNAARAYRIRNRLRSSWNYKKKVDKLKK